MANNVVANYGWFDYLRESMEATDEELNYLRRLHQLKSNQQISEILNSPSVIIDDFLYHGEFNHARDIKLLKELGIQHIINVCNSKLKKEILNTFNVLWININDIPLADISQYFDQTNEFLNTCRSKNEKVLVHCHMGMSRSASIILAYLLKYHHNTLHAAYNHLLERRHIVEPNDGFLIQLIRYEKELNI